jgi:hypothetical protein
MLQLPIVGMRRSIGKHNINSDILCDWIEGNILIDVEEMSTTDVIDVLKENAIYTDQDFAMEMVDIVWSELKRRFMLLGDAASLPIKMSAKRLSRIKSWNEVPGYSFCIILSYLQWYPRWASTFGSDYTEQGEIFEELTKEAMKAFLPGWIIHPTGWTKNNPVTINDVLDDIANRLDETQGSVSRWVDATANELGLDLICYRPFADKRVGKPVFLMQCASGGNWETKLKTPDLDLWTKIIDWASDPKRAFSMPFALSESDFPKKCRKVNGLLLDRYRLLSVGHDNPNWMSDSLKERVITWLEPRIRTLPKIDE